MRSKNDTNENLTREIKTIKNLKDMSETEISINEILNVQLGVLTVA